MVVQILAPIGSPQPHPRRQHKSPAKGQKDLKEIRRWWWSMISMEIKQIIDKSLQR